MNLIKILKFWLDGNEVSLRRFEQSTGIHYTTIYRMLHNRNVRTVEWARLWKWLLNDE